MIWINKINFALYRTDSPAPYNLMENNILSNKGPKVSTLSGLKLELEFHGLKIC